MAARGHRVDFLDARGNAQVQIGDNYYGPDPDSEKRLRILTWLNPPPSGAPRSSRREPGTNLWFLDTDFFQAWHSGNDRFVLLHGIVGCGKTTLLSSIAKKCVELQEPGDLVTAFYFSSTVNEALDLNAFLRFLSAQLCEPGAIPSPLKTLYDSHNRSYPPTSPSDDDLRELVRAQICEPRSRLYDQEPLAGTSMSKVFLLVDGLDEIRDRGVRRDVTGFLNELCSLDTQKLRILATSRPEADILMSLRLERGWSARAIPKDRVRADIEIYVKHELTRHPELEDLDDSVRAELLSRLAGPKQVMFRWANLQLSRLLNARLLLRPDISQILASLPEDLYKTYDRILDEISAAHHEYASTALRWLTLARQPLLVEELIDACSISFQDSGRPSEERRLRPLDLLNLLPNLILLEPRITSPAKRDYQRGTHYALLSHFSVKEYLLGRDMLRRLQPIFHVDAKPCHAFIASACVMYLHWTKIVKGQSLHWPLRQYAWELWAFHCVCSLRSAFPNVEAAALALFEQMAARYLDNSADDDEARPLSTAFDRLISELPHSADRTQVLEALFRPYFVNEYFGESLYAPINTYGQPSIRIVEVLPSFHWFAPVRCLLTTYTMETSPSYETVSYLWGSMDTPKYAWINSHPVHVRPTLSKLLRGLRDAENTRRLWIDAICINQADDLEKNSQVRLMPRIFAESDSVAIWIGEGNELTTWALDIISKLNGVLRFASDMSIRELKAIVNLHPDRDPCVHLRDLFRSGWWTRIWVVQEVALAPRAILLYGERSVTLDAISQLARHHRTVKSALESVLPLNLDSATLWESAEWQRAAGLASITFSMRTGESQLAFSRLFYLTRYRKFSQPQDRFYSLFGMLPSEDYDRLVDYSLSLRQCVQRVFAAVMTQEQSLDMLSFLPQQEMDHTAESLPSWTSSGVWDERVTYAVPLLADLEDENTRLHFHASPHPAEPSFDPPDTLSIDGWHIADLETHTDEDTASREPFFAAVFAAGYAKFADQRSLYTTTHGHRCLVPLDSVPGDSMFILAGGKTPYVLRQRPSGKFRLVGECLTLGLMYGEFFADREDPPSHQRIILI